jgi:hypothetical protein
MVNGTLPIRRTATGEPGVPVTLGDGYQTRASTDVAALIFGGVREASSARREGHAVEPPRHRVAQPDAGDPNPFIALQSRSRR